MQFSVQQDDPFVIFQVLRERARAKHGEEGTIDLSRGDPGYGFTPSVRGREFASLILFLDTVLNRGPEDRFLQWKEHDLKVIKRKILAKVQETYQEDAAKRLFGLLEECTRKVQEYAEEEGKSWSTFTILQHLFSYCAMSGGSYLRPEGQELTRIVLAGWHRREQGVKVVSDDLILTSGASHAIGALFKALGEEGCGYLKSGDTVAIASPVYSPYNRILEERKLNVISFSINPLTGHLSDLSRILSTNDEQRLPTDLSLEARRAKWEAWAKAGTTKNIPKALFLIDPNNPTGFSLPERELEKLALVAREKNMLVITDEVYRSFFPKKKGMLALAPERAICISARSKIERATGLRLGEMVILPEGRKNITAMLGLADEQALRRLIIFAKAPGRVGGEFQHTTFVPGPSQLLGIGHTVLGEEERKAYVRGLEENRAVFASELGLQHEGNLYYVIFDLNELEGAQTRNLPIEEKLLRLADAGVVYLPAYRFFAEEDRAHPGILTSVRASIVNTTPERLREAARRTKKVLCA